MMSSTIATYETVGLSVKKALAQPKAAKDEFLALQEAQKSTMEKRGELKSNSKTEMVATIQGHLGKNNAHHRRLALSEILKPFWTSKQMTTITLRCSHGEEITKASLVLE